MHTFSYLFRKCTIAGAVMAILPVFSGTLAAQVGLGLVPMRVEFPATPGRPYSSALTLSNGSTAKVRVRTELLDLYIDESMTPQFVRDAPAEAEHSCRAWLSVNPMELELAPETQAIVRFTVRVPSTATERSFHCAIGFRTLPTITPESGTGMVTAVRMIAAIYPIVGKPAVAGEIKDLKLEPIPSPAGVAWRAVVVMENSGLMLYRPMGSVDLLDAQGTIVETEKLSSFPALPKRQQRYLLPLKNRLSAGSYTLRAHIDVGNEVQEASAVVRAEPPQVRNIEQAETAK
jgi:hypothetical protein